MIKRLLFLFLVLISSQAIAQSTNPIVIGKTRLTVITPELIRMEYALDGKFIDNTTFFANNRSAFCKDFELTQNGNKYTITKKIMVRTVQ